MPYIKRDDRAVARFTPANAGELNYALTMTIKEYWRRTGNYQGINDIVGALEGAKLEFVRHVVNPYEDKKINENGAIY